MSELDPLNLMGDDGDGNCWGCGQPLGRINVDCPVCLQALDAMDGPAWVKLEEKPQ